MNLTASTITDDELDELYQRHTDLLVRVDYLAAKARDAQSSLAAARRRIVELELDVAQLRWINAKLSPAVPDGQE